MPPTQLTILALAECPPDTADHPYAHVVPSRQHSCNALPTCLRHSLPPIQARRTHGIVRRALPVSSAKQKSRSGGVLSWMAW
ncbi:hypothetical protein O181_110048 [Austropuccinia psidii MF-1]|uniref:Uncharacterized protein n=1 Tax=Austropuccinia psidii MF-1 TaxID=1389203 RepID=A0A9Q3PQE6_9BASI|nr:hypothetical protein [Austropuccinia psidii MF-1]